MQSLYVPKACLAAFYKPGSVAKLSSLQKRLCVQQLVSWLLHGNCKIAPFQQSDGPDVVVKGMYGWQVEGMLLASYFPQLGGFCSQ